MKDCYKEPPTDYPVREINEADGFPAQYLAGLSLEEAFRVGMAYTKYAVNSPIGYEDLNGTAVFKRLKEGQLSRIRCGVEAYAAPMLRHEALQRGLKVRIQTVPMKNGDSLLRLDVIGPADPGFETSDFDTPPKGADPEIWAWQ